METAKSNIQSPDKVTCSNAEKWDEWKSYTIKQIGRSAVRMDPFPHLYIRNIFHRDCYAALMKYWPAIEKFDGQQIAAGGRPMDCPVPDLRLILLAQDAGLVSEDPEAKEFWENFSEFLNGPELSKAFVELTLPQIVNGRSDLPGSVSITPYATLEWDLDGFKVTPHLDSERYLLTCIFYTPEDFSINHLGTALLSPKPHLYERTPNLDHDFITDYWDWDDFDEVARPAFIPNTVCVLIISPKTYHALPPIVNSNGGRRNILLNVYQDFKAPFISLRERCPEKYGQITDDGST